MAEMASDLSALDATPQGQSQPASAAPQSEAASQQDKPVDVVSREDFQRFQSLKDREIQAARAEAQQTKQALAQMRQQVDYLATKDLGDFEKLQYEMRRQAEYIQQLAAEKAQSENAYQAMMAQERLISRIEKKTGVDRKQFADPSLGPDDLWEAAWDIQSKQTGKSSTPTRRPAGQVDLGSGASSPVLSEPDQRRKRAATETFDPDEYWDSLWQGQ